VLLLAPRVIALLTDFGYADPYVASMKGVILSINGVARIVDVSHGVPKFDIRSASYVLYCAYKYFPEGTVFVVVVDPGVGTERRSIVVKTRRYFFVGPDNGVLIPAARDDGIEKVVNVTNRKYMRREVSHTFHGRDIFAPVAAHISRGVPVDEFGEAITDYVVPSFAEPVISGRRAEGEVIYIDGFGNAATNIRVEHVERLGLKYGDEVKVVIEREGEEKYYRWRFLPSFGYAGKGRPLLLINSEGFLEIAVNLGNASRELGISIGDRVIVEPL